MKKKDDILGGTLRQNLNRITESYHQRNGIVSGTGFGKKTIREFDDENVSGPFIKDDGWDKNALHAVGLIDWFDDVAKVQYEVDSAVRGTYGVDGDTAEDLINRLMALIEQLEGVISQMEQELQ